MRLMSPGAWCLGVAFLVLPGRAALVELTPGAQHFQSGLAYERLGRLYESYTELQLASNLDPENSQVAVALGTVASRLGHYDEALRALEHAIALDANSCGSYFELALLYEKKGLTDRALDSWNRFSALNHDESCRPICRHWRH